MNVDAYRLALAGTGGLKMRALALLAEGTAEAKFDAAVALHEVARAEQRAVRALAQPPGEIRLGSAVERCWCLLEGLDPPAAANAYGEVLEASKTLPPAQVRAMRARLEPKFAKARVRYAEALAGLSSLQRARSGEPSWSLPLPRDDELGRLLREFPGVASIWFWRSLGAQRAEQAWTFVRAAAKLEPGDSRYVAGSLRIASQVLSGAELSEFLKTTRAALGPDTATADVWLFLAFAEVDQAAREKGARRVESLRRALDACIEGASRSTDGDLHRTLRAVRLAVIALLENRVPDESVLYEAGLGRLAIETSPRLRKDVIEVLRKKAFGLAA